MALQLPRQFDIEVSRGAVEGYEAISIQGQKDSIGTNFEDVWDVAGNFVYPTAGETWEVVSNNAADTTIGTGAQLVLIRGLDDSFVEQDELVPMNGTTPVVTLRTDWFRITSVLVILSGSGQINAGDITLQVSGGGLVRSRILAGKGQTFNSFFTVPAGKTFTTTQIQALLPKNQDVVFIFRISIGGSNTFISSATLPIYQNVLTTTFTSPIPFPEKTDFRAVAKSKNELTNIAILTEGKLVNGNLSSGLTQRFM